MTRKSASSNACYQLACTLAVMLMGMGTIRMGRRLVGKSPDGMFLVIELNKYVIDAFKQYLSCM